MVTCVEPLELSVPEFEIRTELLKMVKELDILTWADMFARETVILFAPLIVIVEAKGKVSRTTGEDERAHSLDYLGPIGRFDR